ncbi:hypothetical protein ACWEWG_36560 [Streptomyces sp. NPDC003758]
MNAPAAPTERRALLPFETAVRPAVRTNDRGSMAYAGQQFVVAGTKDDWIAIWFGGSRCGSATRTNATP